MMREEAEVKREETGVYIYKIYLLVAGPKPLSLPGPDGELLGAELRKKKMKKKKKKKKP